MTPEQLEEELLTLYEATKNQLEASQQQSRELQATIEKMGMIADDLPEAVREVLIKTHKASNQAASEAAQGALSGFSTRYAAEADKATERLKNAASEVDQAKAGLFDAAKDWSWQVIALAFTFGAAVVFVLLTAVLVWVPDLDEIEARRADLATINSEIKEKRLDLGTCAGTTCVRVIKSKCNFGESGDYCIIDPK